MLVCLLNNNLSAVQWASLHSTRGRISVTGLQIVRSRSGQKTARRPLGEHLDDRASSRIKARRSTTGSQIGTAHRQCRRRIEQSGDHRPHSFNHCRQRQGQGLARRAKPRPPDRYTALRQLRGVASQSRPVLLPARGTCPRETANEPGASRDLSTTTPAQVAAAYIKWTIPARCGTA